MKFTLIRRGGIFVCGIALVFGVFINNIDADGGMAGRGILESPSLTAVFVENLGEYKQPIIQGTVDWEAVKVKIIIDNQLISEVNVEEGIFSYQSEWPLKLGEHFVYAVAIAADRRESWSSNIINFFIIEPDEESLGTMPRISATSTKAFIGAAPENKPKIIESNPGLFKKYFTQTGTSTDGKLADATSAVFAVIILAILFLIYKRNKTEKIDDSFTDDLDDQNNQSSGQDSLFKD